MTTSLPTRALIAALALPAMPAFAAHPLITEDTGTQGRGNFQLELTAELGEEEERGIIQDGLDRAAVLSYGVLDEVDVLLTFPYTRNVVKEDGLRTTDKGPGDVGLDVKWRFFEEGRVSVATKGGVTFATGDEEKGLGAGKTTYNVNLVTSFDAAPWAYHIHVGYLYNRNVLDERTRIRHTSLAVTREVGAVTLVADIGTLTTVDKAYDEDSVFVVLGGIWSVTESFDVDLGVKRGLTTPEIDSALLVGLAIRF